MKNNKNKKDKSKYKTEFKEFSYFKTKDKNGFPLEMSYISEVNTRLD